MNLDLNLPANVAVEEEKDVLGGGSRVLETNVYGGNMELVYLDTNDKGTVSINCHFKKKEDGQVVKISTFISTQAEKDADGKHTGPVRYTYEEGKSKGKPTGKHFPLPGYAQVNSMFRALTGKDFGSAQPTAKKTIMIYDYDAKKDVPKEVDVFTDISGVDTAAAIQKVSEEGTTAASKYQQGTGEFRESNKFVKFFDADGFTTAELKDGAKAPEFMTKWLKLNLKKTFVKKAPIPGVATGATEGAPATGEAAPNPFAKKEA